MEISLKGKKVLVGGGSRGIGRAIALAFARAGADVAVCARGSQSLIAVEVELRQHGTRVFGVSCDLGDEAQVIRYVNESAEAPGGVDILINNASGMGMKDDESGWLQSVKIDLLGTARATRAAIPFLERSKGCIINISSISGLMAVPRSLPYAAIKAAVINYTMGQGLALAPKQIRVNAIAPGSIEFPGGTWESRKTEQPELYQRTLQSIPWGRYGSPEEIRRRCALPGKRPGKLGDRTNDRGRWRSVTDVRVRAECPAECGQRRHPAPIVVLLAPVL